jgi:hypothetical protein
LGSPITHSAASYSTVSALRWLQVRIVPENFVPRRENFPARAEVCQMYSFQRVMVIKILEIKLEGKTAEELQLYKKFYIDNKI